MRQADREITIPWGFRLPEPGESGVRLRATDRESRVPPRFDDGTAVMAGARLRLPPSAMYSNPPPMTSLPPMPTMLPPPRMPQNIWPMPTMPAPALPSLLPAPTLRRRAPVTAAAPLGWRIYVVITTALMAALGTSVFFLTGHASLITHANDVAAPPVINVTVPLPPAPSPSPPLAPAPTSAAPSAPSPARVARNTPRAPATAPAKAPPPPAIVAAAAAAPTVTAPLPPTSPPAPSSTVSPQAQETAAMLREQLGAAVH